MHKKKSFTARLFHYLEGELYVTLKEFDRIEDAIEAGIRGACHSYKVYDDDGKICHEGSRHHHHSYA